MKRFLQHRSKRYGYDGWAVRVKGADKPLEWTVSTTREEARDARRQLDLVDRLRTEIIKVKITVEVA